jgi:hypothetical protein
MSTVPGGVGSKRASSMASVDLPQPVRPTTASERPAGTSRETSSTTLRSP